MLRKGPGHIQSIRGRSGKVLNRLDAKVRRCGCMSFHLRLRKWIIQLYRGFGNIDLEASFEDEQPSVKPRASKPVLFD